MSRAIPPKRFAEFFAGIGLVHEALKASGWECVYANDIDPKKEVMYKGHFGPSPYFYLEDVWQTDTIVDQIPQAPFLATASFPCTDLSLAGYGQGFDGTRSSTYFGFIKVLQALGADKPKLIMIENVTGFLTSKGGSDFVRAVSTLAAEGYWIDCLVLDAKYFVPQSRPRVFVIGFHESLNCNCIIRQGDGRLFDDEWQTAIDTAGSLRPASLLRLMAETTLPTGWATVHVHKPETVGYRLDCVVDNDDEQEWWSRENTLKHYSMMEAPSRNRVDELIRSGATVAGTAFRRTRRGKTRLEVRFDIAGCLRTPKGGSAKQIVVAIKRGTVRMRWMSAREYARLQGAKDFNITVPPLQAMYGFGDGVCVPVIEWIDSNILTPVYESCQTVSVSA